MQARGREWVVLPDSTEDLLIVRPVGGLDEEVVGILPAIEPVASATFRLPSAAMSAISRLVACCVMPHGSRHGAAAGPFRSFGRSLSSRALISSYADDGAQARSGAAARRR